MYSEATALARLRTSSGLSRSDSDDALWSVLKAEVAVGLGLGNDHVRLAPSSVPGIVDDSPLKIRVEDSQGTAVGFVLLGSAGFPASVSDAAEAADGANRSLGHALGQLVVVPVACGAIGGRSYALFPYYHPLKEGRLSRAIFRARIAPRILSWLSKVSERTTEFVRPDQMEALILEPLEFLGDCSDLPLSVRTASAEALTCLRYGRVQPYTVFSHNDFWLGNILVSTRSVNVPWTSGVGSPRIIDWGGSAVRGVPAFDGLVFSRSAGLSVNRAGKMLSDLCSASRVSPESTRLSLLAGLGRIGRRNDRFPRARFAKLAVETMSSFERALGKGSSRGPLARL